MQQSIPLLYRLFRKLPSILGHGWTIASYKNGCDFVPYRRLSFCFTHNFHRNLGAFWRLISIKLCVKHDNIRCTSHCVVILILKKNPRECLAYHDDVIKWKHFLRYWPFVRGIHRSPLNSPHKGQWHGALMFSLICARINGWVNNREAGDLRRHQAHCDFIVMPVAFQRLVRK